MVFKPTSPRPVSPVANLRRHFRHLATRARLSRHLYMVTSAQELTIYINPNTLTRMPPTQYPLSGKAAPPPNSRDAFPSLQQGADPLGWTQGDPREPQGAQGYRRAPSAPLGGMGPRGPLGLYRSHSEWYPVSTGRYLRREGQSFRKKAVRMERPFRMDGSSEWKAVPCVHTAAETPNRMSADLVGF